MNGDGGCQGHFRFPAQVASLRAPSLTMQDRKLMDDYRGLISGQASSNPSLSAETGSGDQDIRVCFTHRSPSGCVRGSSHLHMYMVNQMRASG